MLRSVQKRDGNSIQRRMLSPSCANSMARSYAAQNLHNNTLQWHRPYPPAPGLSASRLLSNTFALA
jgi:hypothetical protein